MNYGLPYKGSKSKICNFLVSHFPDTTTFVDVFSGGCSVTHKCMLDYKYKHYIINDLAYGFAELFIDSIRGGRKREFIFCNREEFFLKKETDRFISLSFSFGNDNSTYCYSKESEPYRLACHNIIVNNDYSLFSTLCPEIKDGVINRMENIVDNKRVALGKAILECLKNISIERTNSLYNQYLPYINGKKGLHISPCYHLEKQERIFELYNPSLLEGITYDIKHDSFEDLEIPDGSIVYCDPPYNDTTNSYGNSVIIKRFYDWCVEKSKRNFVFISEYCIEDDRFVCINSKNKRVNSSAITTTVKEEKLYTVRQ